MKANPEVLTDYEIVEMFNFKTHAQKFAVMAKYGRGRNQGYVLPYRFDTDEEAHEKAGKLMPEFPMLKSTLTNKVFIEYFNKAPLSRV